MDGCGEAGPSTVVVVCRVGRENWCEQFPTLTYGNVDPKDAMPTRGGYSTEYVLPAKFTYHVPDGLPAAAVAPLMCAGVTTYVPLKRWGAGPGKRVGIVGLGGLGHLALKIAHHLGAEVVQFTRTMDKAAEARALGADDVVLTTDQQQVNEALERLARNDVRYRFVLDMTTADK